MSKKLFCDLKTDEEKSNFFLSGRGYETGVIGASIQNDVAMAYHRCAEYKKEIERLRSRVVQPSVPGYKLVPVIPTVDMTVAARSGEAFSIYRAMLAAAPTPPASGQAQQDEPCEHSEHVRPSDRVCVECGETVVQKATQP